MSLKFIKKDEGIKRMKAEVSISSKPKDYTSVSFKHDALTKITGGGKIPLALMVAIEGNKMFFVPSNSIGLSSFTVYKDESGRPFIRISKKVADTAKFEGKYNFHFDDKESAYCIDRKFLLN